MARKTNPYVTLGDANAFGIDVSKADLSLCWLTGTGEHWHEISNRRQPLERLARLLVAADYEGKIIIESTGYYHWLAVVVLSEQGLDVRLVNPLLAHKHHQGGIRKLKTDPVDAYNLAGMALTERRLPPSWQRDTAWVRYRHRIGLICSVDRSLQQLKASLSSHRDALAIMGCGDDAVVAAFEEQVRNLERTRKAVETELAAEFAGLNEVNQARYRSIPGLSDYVSGLLNLMLSTDAPKAKSWIAFVGLDIGVRKSGTWEGRAKLSKRGMGYLRKKLFQAAWSAKQNDPHFRVYYDHLRAEGRPYVETLLIIARKLLRIAFHLQQRQQMYDPALAWT